jgi:hypothetical protein
METIFHIIFFVLFIAICICAGYAFGSCIGTDKKLKEINKRLTEIDNRDLKLIKLLEEENNHCKDIINHCKDVINDNRTLLSNMTKALNLINNYLLFIKQNMIRRKTPITDE